MAQSSSPMVSSSSTEIRVQSNLNPFAKEWNPSTERGSEEERSLFFTFSSGLPLRRSQIRRFFSEKYGNCVERIALRSSKGQKGSSSSSSSTPQYGQVVFNISTLPALILNGKDQVKFMVNRRSFWCKKFQDRKTRHANNGEN